MPRKTLTIAAAVAAAALGGTALTTVGAGWAARSEVERLVAAHPGLQVGGTDVDLFGGRVTLRDVTVTSGTLQVRAGRLDLPLNAPRFALVPSAFAQGSTSAPATGGTASASDVTITRGPTTYVAKKIDLTGTPLSSADLAALLDPKNPDALAARLQKFKADTMAVSELTSSSRTTGGEVRASLTQVVLAKVADGKIGTLSVASGSASTAGAQNVTIVKTGTIQASGVDLALLERMANTVRTDDAEPLRTLAEAATVNDVSVVNSEKKTTVAVAAISQKGLKARPFKTDLSKLNEPITGDPVTDKAARSERTRFFLDDFGSSVEVAAVSAERVTLSNADADADGSGKLAAAVIAVDSYRDRRLGAVKVRDFTFEGPKARFGFSTFDLADIVFPPPGPRENDPSALATDAFPAIGKADLTAVDMDAATPQEDGSVSRIKFKVAHVGSVGDRLAGRFPTRGDVTVDHVTVDVSTGNGAASHELLAMGYRQLDISAALTTTYDRDLQALSVQKLLVSGVDMGAATLALDLGNVSPNILSANQSVAKASALAMLLKRIDLRLANAGLVEKGLELKAKHDGKSVAEERDAATELVAVTLPEGLGNGPGIKKIGAALAAFLADPKTLHVSLVSKDGLGASDIGLIGSPDDLLSRLDIQAEANQ